MKAKGIYLVRKWEEVDEGSDLDVRYIPWNSYIDDVFAYQITLLIS